MSNVAKLRGALPIHVCKYAETRFHSSKMLNVDFYVFSLTRCMAISYAKRNSFVRLYIWSSLSLHRRRRFHTLFHSIFGAQLHMSSTSSSYMRKPMHTESVGQRVYIHSVCAHSPHSLLSILAIVVRRFALACRLLRLWLNVCTLCTHIRHQTHIKRNEILSKL